MQMVHTVGLLGGNGRVGAPTARLLALAAREDKIKLVLFHRTGHPPTNFTPSSNVELRYIDVDGASTSLQRVVKGIQVFIRPLISRPTSSALSLEALHLEARLVDALAASEDLITYVPSVFSAPWAAEDKTDELLAPALKWLHAGWDRAKEQGLAITTVYVGTFEDYFFEHGFLGSPIKGNIVWANGRQLAHKFPITLAEHLARALTQIATSDPEAVRNTSFSTVTYWPTGRDLMDLYSKLNGRPAEARDYTSADREAFRADAANFGPAKAFWWDRWEREDWGYEAEGIVNLSDYPRPTLEQTVQRFI